jgi:hypothetical protein
MATKVENRCCHEKLPIIKKMDDFNANHQAGKEPISCIVQHPGFTSNCLDVWTLQTAYSHYRQQYRATVNAEINE